MLPPDLPEDFALLARQCLDRNPDRRPSVAALQRWLEPPRESRLPSPSNAALAAPKALPRPRAFIAAIVGLLVVAAAVLAGLHALNSPSAAEREVPSEAVTQNPTAPPQPETPAAGGRAAVLHEEIPDVPPHARATIRGRIKVAIRVSVDRSGTVINETLETRGSSQYFTRLAMAAAKQWKFAASNDQKSRSCLLRFEFARDGVTGHAANTSNL
jgi:TonB family protein